MFSRLGLLGMVFMLGFASAGEAKYGLKNFKEVMPGALYRGGSTGGKSPMNSSALGNLCEAGFSTAFYLYGRSGSTSKSCGGNTITYVDHNYSKSEDKILRAVHKAITTGAGPVYAHCWYGVHASGYVAAVALRQFCGYSASQAVDYWNRHVPKKIQYEKVQKRIRNFDPKPGLSITSAQRAKHCP